MASAPSVTHDPAARRYDLHLDGRIVGHATYHDVGGALSLDHTETDPALGGQGLGGRLVAAILDDVRAAGGTVIPACPFAAWYVEQHPAYQDLLARS